MPQFKRAMLFSTAKMVVMVSSRLLKTVGVRFEMDV